jgi:hypothetical protein
MIVRRELPCNTGADSDGIAQIETDHFEKYSCLFAVVRYARSRPGRRARLKFWKDRDRRHAKALCIKRPRGSLVGPRGEGRRRDTEHNGWAARYLA